MEKVTKQQIDITPEMIRAGWDTDINFDPKFYSQEDRLMNIFLAMLTGESRN